MRPTVLALVLVASILIAGTFRHPNVGSLVTIDVSSSPSGTVCPGATELRFGPEFDLLQSGTVCDVTAGPALAPQTYTRQLPLGEAVLSGLASIGVGASHTSGTSSIDFDNGDEAVWVVRMPGTYSENLTVNMEYTAGASDSIVMEARFNFIDPATAQAFDEAIGSFGAVNSISETAPAVSGNIGAISTPITDTDETTIGDARGKLLMIHLERNYVDVDVFKLRHLELEWTRSQ